MKWAVLLVACTGCDQVFGIREIGKVADAPADVDCAALADEDGDCVADSVDNCPVTPNPDQRDGETPMDGVGDACDPHPTDPHDTIVRFWSFLGDGPGDMAAWPAADPASMWSYPGDGTIVHTDQTDAIGEVVSQPTYDSSELTAEVGFTFHAWTGDTSATVIAVHVDDSPTGTGGHSCVVSPYNNTDPTLDRATLVESTGNGRSTAIPELHDGDHVALRMHRSNTPAQLTCHVTVNDTAVDTGVVPITVVPADRHVSIIMRYTSAEVRYVVIYGRTN